MTYKCQYYCLAEMVETWRACFPFCLPSTNIYLLCAMCRAWHQALEVMLNKAESS